MSLSTALALRELRQRISSAASSSATRLLLLLGLLLGLSGCASTTIVGRWSDPSFHGPGLHQVLVIGIQGDQRRRRLWEDAMVAALKSQGVAAAASYRVFPDRAPDADQLSSTAARRGFDGLVATHFVGTTAQMYWMPGYAGMGFGYWDATYGPGYVGPQYQSDYQTDIFTIGPDGGKLIWTGVTRSLDLSPRQNATAQISHALVPALRKAAILAGGTA